jgi:hypothetical protein
VLWSVLPAAAERVYSSAAVCTYYSWITVSQIIFLAMLIITTVVSTKNVTILNIPKISYKLTKKFVSKASLVQW